MKSWLPIIAFITLIGLSGCQTSGVTTEEWVKIKSDQAWLDMNQALFGANSYSIYAKADWKRYQEIHIFKDPVFTGEIWLGALNTKWHWTASDNAADFRQAFSNWNKFEQSPPKFISIQKASLGRGPVVYTAGTFQNEDCVFFHHFYNRAHTDDTKYRVQVIGYSCRSTGGIYSSDEILGFVEKINTKNSIYTGTGIPKESLVAEQ